MVVNELDVVKLVSGERGTVLMVFGQPAEAYLIELSGSDEQVTIKHDQVKEVLYKY